MPGIAEKERRARDLRAQVAELEPGLEGEVVFEHIRTRRGIVTIYSMKDGEAIPIPEYMVKAALTKVVDGEYMFTDDPSETPEYRKGTVKCFLHAESSERTSGVLGEIGLAGKTCPAGSLASVHSKRTHGERRHGREWAAYKEYLDDKKEEKAIARQEKQLDATIALAGKATRQGESDDRFLDEMSAKMHRQPEKLLNAMRGQAGPPGPSKGECDFPGCGRTGLKNVSAHKRGAHRDA